MNRPVGYVDVDRLQSETTLADAAAKCGVTLEARGSGPEVRIDCPFGCPGDHGGRKDVAINTENPQKVFMCHAYECKFRGNMLTLIHGWLTGSKPSGDKLKGDEFRRVTRVLTGQAEPTAGTTHAKSQEKSDSPPPKPEHNTPLVETDDDRVRELHNIDEKFVVDAATMNPAAAAYVRQHPCLSPESMKKWRAGYLPNDGGGDKRGWSLRGGIVYPVLSEQGKVLAWVGRDVNYDEKEREFARLTTAERADKDPPAKHRFPKGFHRGIELFGQQSSRLRETGYREFIAKHGIVVVEGFNDVIGLDNLGIPAVAVMSNKITNEQVAKVERWARTFAGDKVTLLFDADQAGDDGAKDALWLFSQRKLTTRVAWSRAMNDGVTKKEQPEMLTQNDVITILATA